MQRLKLFFRAKRRAVRWRIKSAAARWTNPTAYRFFAELMKGGFHPDALIDVVPDYRLIYVGVPKAACSTIKRSLSTLTDRNPTTLDDVHRRRLSGLRSPSEIGVEAFYRLAIAQDTLRFAFVRNPYERLVSCWADKYQGRPLVAGDPFINVYLAFRKRADPLLPHGRDAVLPFPAFVEMAIATSTMRLDPHWSPQDDLLNMPGIALDMIGKTESFEKDYERVVAHVGAYGRMLAVTRHLNISKRSRCRDYFDDQLAKRVHRAYERDFDRFGYPSALPD